MSNLVCHCFLPGLSIDAEVLAEHFGSAAIELPFSLRRLTKRGDSARLAPVDHDSALLRAHGIASESAHGAAAIMAAGDGLDAGQAAWLRADPVHLSVEQDRLVLRDAQFLDLTHGEAQALCETLNAHFAPDNIEFVVADAQRWYIRLASMPEISTTPLSTVLGQDIHRHLPRGAEAMVWHRRYNELQMLLHDHPVNQAREQRGALPVNSVWWWGEGADSKAAAGYTSLLGNDPLLRGLAAKTQTLQRALPKSADAWLASPPGAGEHLILLDDLLRPWGYRLETEWREALARIESTWFAPLAAALACGTIKTIKISALTAQAQHIYTIDKRMLWRFWRG